MPASKSSKDSSGYGAFAAVRASMHGPRAVVEEVLLDITERNYLRPFFTGYCACVTAEVDYQVPARWGAALVPMGGERANRAAGLSRDGPFYRAVKPVGPSSCLGYVTIPWQ